MRFSFFSLAAATVCLAAGAFAASPSVAAQSGASVAASERHSNSVAASVPSSVAYMQSAPAVQSSAAASVSFENEQEDVDESTLEGIQRGALADIASLLISLLAGILKAVVRKVLGGLGLSMTDDQINQVQQEALEQIDAMGGADVLQETLRLGGLKGLIQFLVNVVIPIIKKILGGATSGAAGPTVM